MFPKATIPSLSTLIEPEISPFNKIFLFQFASPVISFLLGWPVEIPLPFEELSSNSILLVVP
jgi:hypothetical protein